LGNSDYVQKDSSHCNLIFSGSVRSASPGACSFRTIDYIFSLDNKVVTVSDSGFEQT